MLQPGFFRVIILSSILSREMRDYARFMLRLLAKYLELHDEALESLRECCATNPKAYYLATVTIWYGINVGNLIY